MSETRPTANSYEAQWADDNGDVVVHSTDEQIPGQMTVDEVLEAIEAEDTEAESAGEFKSMDDWVQTMRDKLEGTPEAAELFENALKKLRARQVADRRAKQIAAQRATRAKQHRRRKNKTAKASRKANR